MQKRVLRWQQGFLNEGLKPQDRVAILLANCWQWVAFDQAAHSMGLVVVPLYCNDNPENIAYVLKDSGAKLLLIEELETWEKIANLPTQFKNLKRVVCMEKDQKRHNALFRYLSQWLPETTESIPCKPRQDGSALATIIYTSGTTGHPKGVMLNHTNILANAYSALMLVPAYPSDLFLSFLPLSHALERTAGYYLPMMAGSTVAFARSIALLGEDLQHTKPTIIMSVPRIYERIHQDIQHRLVKSNVLTQYLFNLALKVGWDYDQYKRCKQSWRPGLLLQPLLYRLVGAKVQKRLGGRLRVAVCGGAHLSETIGRFFLGLGIPLTQGYGLTESAPIISINPLQENNPASVGRPLPGIKTLITSQGELLVKGPTVMMGYWNNPKATQEAIDTYGWLHTGDQAMMKNGHIHITGRLKEIIVLSNGRKIPPADMEASIATDPLVNQALIIGEQAPYLSALIVLETKEWQELSKSLHLNPKNPESLHNHHVQNALLQRIGNCLSSFPGFAKVRSVSAILDPWTVENGFLTPTLKLRRTRILHHFSTLVDRMYEGHRLYADG